MMQKNNPGFFGNFLYVFGSQMIVLISGFIKALVIPVLLGISDYGYWQIYVFYTIYIGVFTFGYGDGVYLKYGGYKLIDLPFNRLRTANALYLLVLALGAAALVAYAVTNADPNRQLVYLAVAANVAVLGVTSIVSLTLQATNQLKGYAFLNSADKVFFALALLALFKDDFQTFEYLITVDLAGKVIVMILLVSRYRQLFIGPLTSLADGTKEFSSSAGAGIQLLIANLSGMLVLGVGRIIVEYLGALENYAYYAFAVSLANVVLVAISALSIVIYPTLMRQTQERISYYFEKTNNTYGIFSLVLLTGYFPAVAFIQLIATQYIPVIEFLSVMFAITALEGKMQLVNNTYFKALRLERQMLVANVSSLLIATVLSLVGFLLTQSILAIAYATLLTMLARVYTAQIALRRHMGHAPDPRMIAEAVVLAAFLLITTRFDLVLAAGAWLVLSAVIAYAQRGELSAALRQVRRGVR